MPCPIGVMLIDIPCCLKCISSCPEPAPLSLHCPLRNNELFACFVKSNFFVLVIVHSAVLPCLDHCPTQLNSGPTLLCFSYSHATLHLMSVWYVLLLLCCLPSSRQSWHVNTSLLSAIPAAGTCHHCLPIKLCIYTSLYATCIRLFVCVVNCAASK